MNLLKHVEDAIALYEKGAIMAAESIDRAIMIRLQNYSEPGYKVVLCFLGEPYASTYERVEQLKKAYNFLLGGFQNPIVKDRDYYLEMMRKPNHEKS
jgi:hypothetical protein